MRIHITRLVFPAALALAAMLLQAAPLPRIPHRQPDRPG